MALFANALAGKVVLVTGASSGIGQALAGYAAVAGARVVLAARREKALHELAGELEDAGGEAEVVALDVTDDDSVAAAIELAFARWGRLDVLVNNAGVAATGRASETARQTNQAIWAVNVEGPFQMARRCAGRWIAAGQPGVVVNVASILGLAGLPGVAGYCASKAALVNLTRALAVEWARHGIRVNALAPGYVRTELNAEQLDGHSGEALLKRIPMRRFGEMADLSGPFLLLASDASRFMTGSVLVVDGGHTAGA